MKKLIGLICCVMSFSASATAISAKEYVSMLDGYTGSIDKTKLGEGLKFVLDRVQKQLPYCRKLVPIIYYLPNESKPTDPKFMVNCDTEKGGLPAITFSPLGYLERHFLDVRMNNPELVRIFGLKEHNFTTSVKM